MKQLINSDIIKEILEKLKEKNDFFVSEAHLQTEFIIVAASLYPNYKYFPELSPSIIPSNYKYGKNGLHFDLLIKAHNQKILVEFKYITYEYRGKIDEFESCVKLHAALGKRRYDCWKDIERIETFTKANETDIDYGYFILVTNVPAIWKESAKRGIDADFNMSEGFHKAGKKTWKTSASEATIKKRKNSIETKNDYYFEYNEFSSLNGKHGLFKYLVVEINN